eukprot:9553376-Alexandrium_andersonii.AAC.1
MQQHRRCSRLLAARPASGSGAFERPSAHRPDRREIPHAELTTSINRPSWPFGRTTGLKWGMTVATPPERDIAASALYSGATIHGIWASTGSPWPNFKLDDRPAS